MENKKTTETFDIFELLKKAKTHGLETLSDKVERGKELIDPLKHQSWEKDVIKDTYGCFYGYITECALEIMEAIEEGNSLEEIEEIERKQKQTKLTKNGIKDIVNKYSRKGYPEYTPRSLTDMSRKLKERR